MTEPVAQVSLRAKVGVAILALALAVLAAEGLLRLFWNNPYGPGSTRMLVELQTLTKGIDWRIDRSVVNANPPIIMLRTNARGYIEPAIRFARPDLTVAFLGGSTTECRFVQEGLRFPARVSFLLEQKGLKVNALNMGVSGNDSHQSINNLFNYVITDKPDVVVLMHAANDIGHLRAAGDYTVQMGNTPTLSTLGRLLFTKGASRSSLLALVRHVKTLRDNKRNADDARTGLDLRLNQRLRVLPVEKFRQRLRTFVGMCRAFGITPVLMTQPSDGYRNELTPGWINQSDQAMFNDATREVAAEQHADLIDLVALLRARQPPPSAPLFYDGIHVTDYGSQLYGEHVAERLQQILAARR
jgi:lysophospholipase L1-like esterase